MIFELLPEMLDEKETFPFVCNHLCVVLEFYRFQRNKFVKSLIFAILGLSYFDTCVVINVSIAPFILKYMQLSFVKISLTITTTQKHFFVFYKYFIMKIFTHVSSFDMTK